jgi:hypothetical protein
MLSCWCISVTLGGVLEGMPYNNNAVFEALLNTPYENIFRAAVSTYVKQQIKK